MTRRRKDDVIDAQYTDVGDGSPVNGHITRYDPGLHTPPTPKDIVLALGQSLISWISPEAQEDRDDKRDKRRVQHAGELVLLQKGIEGDLLDAEIDNQKNAKLKLMDARKEVTQQDIKDRADIEFTEYQVAKALESQKKEVDARQEQIDAMKLARQIQEIKDLHLPPQEEAYRIERTYMAWRGEGNGMDLRAKRQKTA